MQVHELQFQPFRPKEASEQEWNKALDMSRTAFEENNPGDPIPPGKLVRKQIEALDEHPFVRPEMYTLKQADDTTVGRLLLAFPKPENPEYERQKHMGIMQAYVLPEFRKQGYGTAMLEKAVKAFREHGMTLIQGDTSIDAGRAFAERFGAKIAIEGRVNRLYLKDVDWELMETWCKVAASKNPDVTIESFEGLPDEAEIEDYARLYTEVMNQQPFEELEGMEFVITPQRLRTIHEQEQERGDIHTVRITREKDGIISGITEIVHNPQRPHLITQELTGVQEQFRGRGLGKWLKADMLLYIRDAYPNAKFINTGNANSNVPMLAINNRMGFKPHKHNTIFKLQIADAMKHLDLL